MGRLTASRSLRLAIGLPLRNPTALTNLILQICDPASPNYRHYLTPEQFTERFGPTDLEYQAVMAFAQENGISGEDFAKAYNSFSVSSNLQRAEQLTQRYQVQGVPLVVINGKYATDVAKAGNPNDLISLINDLAGAEHRH